MAQSCNGYLCEAQIQTNLESETPRRANGRSVGQTCLASFIGAWSVSASATFSPERRLSRSAISPLGNFDCQSHSILVPHSMKDLVSQGGATCRDSAGLASISSVAVVVADSSLLGTRWTPGVRIPLSDLMTGCPNEPLPEPTPNRRHRGRWFFSEDGTTECGNQRDVVRSVAGEHNVLCLTNICSQRAKFRLQAA